MHGPVVFLNAGKCAGGLDRFIMRLVAFAVAMILSWNWAPLKAADCSKSNVHDVQLLSGSLLLVFGMVFLSHAPSTRIAIFSLEPGFLFMFFVLGWVSLWHASDALSILRAEPSRIGHLCSRGPARMGVGTQGRGASGRWVNTQVWLWLSKPMVPFWAR